MIIVIEHDVRRHGGRRFAWRPGYFSGIWNGKRTRRFMWGLWSLSYYQSPGLNDFFRYIEAGNTEWRDA